MSPDETSFAEIDRLVHEPARLHILTVLSLIEAADFLFLMRQTGLTKGNLSSHLGKLEAARYVDIEKEFVEKIPHTVVKITSRGREALQTYRQQMTGVLKKLPK
ncbi:MAG: ArsR family transcriptional regulator [Anaerolineae bacterium CFX3]|nr:ArsR family transcriptional regulator [Anaerolineae bacterium CFX3]MCQ3947739.1 transcriptional regulator [Anaerolineae bacterium]RIK24976.1 MAG: ArsR family transcriptional regulator [Anaerolineae bacterium]HPP64193.1 transcriptional regulator [Anaerolineales bacterium]